MLDLGVVLDPGVVVVMVVVMVQSRMRGGEERGVNGDAGDGTLRRRGREGKGKRVGSCWIA